jgi:DinB superfamily
MDKKEKLDIIHRFETAVDLLIDLVKHIPPAALDFRPAVSGAWTIREHAVHFLDADTFAHARVRLTVTEPGAELFVWDESAWRAKGRYDTTDPLTALEAARSLRRIGAAMARSLVEDDWQAYHVHHAVRGRMTLADVLNLYADHAEFHLKYFQRNLDAFRDACT